MRDLKERVIAVGEVGEPFSLEEASLTLETIPEQIKLRTPYHFSLQPLQEVSMQLMDTMEISPNKKTVAFSIFLSPIPAELLGKSL